jgi:hypothetical protein
VSRTAEHGESSSIKFENISIRLRKDQLDQLREEARQNLLDLRPASACISGNWLTPSKAFEKCNGGSGEEEFSSSIFSMSGNTCIQHGFKGIPICQKLIKMQSQLDSANASHNRLADLYYLLSK